MICVLAEVRAHPHAFINIDCNRRTVKCAWCRGKVGTVAAGERFSLTFFRIARIDPSRTLNVCTLDRARDPISNSHSHHPILILRESLPSEMVRTVDSTNFHIGSEVTFNCPYARFVDVVTLSAVDSFDTNRSTSGAAEDSHRASDMRAVNVNNRNSFVDLFRRELENEPSSSSGVYSNATLTRAMYSAQLQLQRNEMSSQNRMGNGEIENINETALVGNKRIFTSDEVAYANQVTVVSGDHSYANVLDDTGIMDAENLFGGVINDVSIPDFDFGLFGDGNEFLGASENDANANTNGIGNDEGSTVENAQVFCN